MNIYDTAHKLAEEIRKSDECVHLAELRERAYADETNRLQAKCPARICSGFSSWPRCCI